MNPLSFRIQTSIPAIASACLAVAIALTATVDAEAAPGKSLYAASEPASSRAAEPAELPPPPPPASPAMEEKFRKLQKEMEREPASKPGSGPKQAAEPEPQGGIALGKLFMQIVFGLIFVLLLAVVSIRGLKRLQGRLLSKPGKGGDIFEVLETCHLGPRQRVVAMRMNEDVGILGITEKGITLITVLKEPIEEVRRARGGESNSAAFSDNLNKLLDRFKKPKRVSDMLDEGAA